MFKNGPYDGHTGRRVRTNNAHQVDHKLLFDLSGHHADGTAHLELVILRVLLRLELHLQPQQLADHVVHVAFDVVHRALGALDKAGRR